MDEETKDKVRSLGNRISGVKTQLKKKPGDEELTSRLADLTRERDELRGPQVERKPRAKVTTENTLPMRRALASRDLKRSQLGVPSLDELKKHATKFGGGGVPEAAAEYGYGHEELVSLMETCDQADADLRRKKNPRAHVPNPGDIEKRVRAILGESDE